MTLEGGLQTRCWNWMELCKINCYLCGTVYNLYCENRMVWFVFYGVGVSFEYDIFCFIEIIRLTGYTYVIEIQESLICWILICPQKVTVLVQMCTVLFWVWFSVFFLLMIHSRMFRRKVLGVIVGFENILGCGQVIVKNTRNICFVTNISVVMVL
jgi:hypothetical protein